MNYWQQIAFLEEEIIPSLREQLKMLESLTKNQAMISWYKQAIKDIESFKHYFINKESDEQDYRETTWT